MLYKIIETAMLGITNYRKICSVSAPQHNRNHSKQQQQQQQQHLSYSRDVPVSTRSGDTLRLGLLPPLRGGRLAWPAPRAWDNPNPALPPYDVKTPHTWSPAYGGSIARRSYLQDSSCVYWRVYTCVYVCVCKRRAWALRDIENMHTRGVDCPTYTETPREYTKHS